VSAPSPRLVTLKAEPLTPEAYAPFGSVIEPGRTQLHCNDGQYVVELLTLQPRNGPVRQINRHFDCVQLFAPHPQAGTRKKPMLVVVAPPWLSAERFDPAQVRAFVADGSQAFTFNVGTWHIGPRSLDGTPLTLVNMQGERSNEEHTEEIDLAELTGAVVEFELPG
jgi:ureidoglycolate lyase